MKLIFIYGPPAVGKLSVARELAKLTGFRLFHNHVSIQFVESVFKFGTKAFGRLVDKFRLEMLEEAAKEGVDTIFTFVYVKGVDDPFVRRAVRMVRSQGGQVCFVRLFCGKEELARRVGTEVRKNMGKMSTKSALLRLFATRNLFSEISFQSSVNFDTTVATPRTVAKLVAQHYKLPVSKRTMPTNRRN